MADFIAETCKFLSLTTVFNLTYNVCMSTHYFCNYNFCAWSVSVTSVTASSSNDRLHCKSYITPGIVSPWNVLNLSSEVSLKLFKFSWLGIFINVVLQIAPEKDVCGVPSLGNRV